MTVSQPPAPVIHTRFGFALHSSTGEVSYKGMETATAYRYLVRLPGVGSGHTIVANTRIGVHDVIGLIVNGASLEDVQRNFPGLTKAQIYECLAYYEDHRAEIDALVAEQMSEAL